MSSIFLSLITIICVLFLLPAFHYLPVREVTPALHCFADNFIESRPILNDYSCGMVLD